jgi:hypothetical protein
MGGSDGASWEKLGGNTKKANALFHAVNGRARFLLGVPFSIRAFAASEMLLDLLALNSMLPVTLKPLPPT